MEWEEESKVFFGRIGNQMPQGFRLSLEPLIVEAVEKRFCFGMTCHNATEVPVHLYPLLKKFIDKSPFQSDVHKFTYGGTLTFDGIYHKIEDDYNGPMVNFLLMSIKTGLESYK